MGYVWKTVGSVVDSSETTENGVTYLNWWAKVTDNLKTLFQNRYSSIRKKEKEKMYFQIKNMWLVYHT